MKRKIFIKIILLIIIILLLLLIYNQFNKLIYVSKTIEAYKNYNDEAKPRLSENESCAVISVEKAKELLHTEVLAEEALTSVSIILFSAVSQTFGGFLTDGETNKRYVLSKGTEYAGLSSL